MEIIYKESTQSTNEDVKALPENADHVAICAKTQSGGHGRLGRKWLSPAGNLYVSFCIRLDNLAAAGNYSFLSAVALAQALESFGLKPQCKWPNDLLIDGKKVSGILLETDGKSRLIVGIGVNLLPVEAENLLYPVTSLANEGVETTPREVLSRLVECFEALEKLPFSAVLDGWRQRAYGLGQPITVNLPTGKVQGTFYGLDNDGVLLLKCGQQIMRITAGDVFFGEQGKK